MVSPVEALIQRIAVLGAYLGSIISVIFANFQEVVMANGAAVVSVMTLLMNWYYQRRRDRREQEKHEQETEQ